MSISVRSSFQLLNHDLIFAGAFLRSGDLSLEILLQLGVSDGAVVDGRRHVVGLRPPASGGKHAEQSAPAQHSIRFISGRFHFTGDGCAALQRDILHDSAMDKNGLRVGMIGTGAISNLHARGLPEYWLPDHGLHGHL